MDEITMFAAIRPAPLEQAEPSAPRARIRLEEALGATGGRRRGSGRRPGGLGRFRFRRPVLLAGAAAVAACAAIVVPAVLPAGGAGSLVSAAWAVQRNADGTVTVTIKDVFDLGGLQQALASDGVPARVITVATDPAAYTGPLVAADPVNRTTVSGCFYPATGSNFEPAPVQQAVVTQAATPVGTDITTLYDIHPAAMPAGSVLLIQGVVIGGQGPRAAADVSELVSFPAPAVLVSDSLPASCTWRVIATFPFTLVQRQHATN
ncbi:MAG: hypothetical protein ACRDOA_00955 [Streptosporangiaceae bacterium]